MADSTTPDGKLPDIMKAEDTIRVLLLALEQDHGVMIRRVEVICDAPIKFTTSIHIE